MLKSKRLPRLHGIAYSHLSITFLSAVLLRERKRKPSNDLPKGDQYKVSSGKGKEENVHKQYNQDTRRNLSLRHGDNKKTNDLKK